MGEVRVSWLQDLQFVGTDSTNHSVVISKPGEKSVGMKPSDLLLIAVAACTGVDVANILRKKRVALTQLSIWAKGEQEAEPPWAFRKIHIRYEVRGAGLSEKALAQAIRLSEEKYCSVSATLRPSVELSWEYELLKS